MKTHQIIIGLFFYFSSLCFSFESATAKELIEDLKLRSIDSKGTTSLIQEKANNNVLILEPFNPDTLSWAKFRYRSYIASFTVSSLLFGFSMWNGSKFTPSYRFPNAGDRDVKISVIRHYDNGHETSRSARFKFIKDMVTYPLLFSQKAYLSFSGLSSLSFLYYAYKNSQILKNETDETLLEKGIIANTLIQLTPQGIYIRGYNEPLPWDDFGYLLEVEQYQDNQKVGRGFHFKKSKDSASSRFVYTCLGGLTRFELYDAINHYKSEIKNLEIEDTNGDFHVSSIFPEYKLFKNSRLWKHKYKILLTTATAIGFSYSLYKNWDTVRTFGMNMLPVDWQQQCILCANQRLKRDIHECHNCSKEFCTSCKNHIFKAPRNELSRAEDNFDPYSQRMRTNEYQNFLESVNFTWKIGKYNQRTQSYDPISSAFRCPFCRHDWDRLELM